MFVSKKLKKTICTALSVVAFASFASFGSVGTAEASQEVPTQAVQSVLHSFISENNSSLSDAEINRLANGVIYYSYQYNLDPLVVASMISQESTFHQTSSSPVGAIGLGQLMPDTARALGVNPYDDMENLEGACSYLSTQLKNFSNTPYPMENALSAYNAGPNAVRKYGGIPPYAETQNYVQKIRGKYFNLYNRLLSDLTASNAFTPITVTRTPNTAQQPQQQQMYNVTYKAYDDIDVGNTGYDVVYDSEDDFSY